MIKHISALKGKRAWIILLAVVGAVLLVLPGIWNDSEDGDTDSDTAILYSEALEEKLERLCCSIDGVSFARVLVTLDGGSEYVYAENTESRKSSDSTNTARDYLIIEGKSGSSPVVISEIYPKIRGVAIVCTGGDEPVMREKIVSLVSAALGISSNRISVAGGG
jgi:stage III sporulation protein AG